MMIRNLHRLILHRLIDDDCLSTQRCHSDSHAACVVVWIGDTESLESLAPDRFIKKLLHTRCIRKILHTRAFLFCIENCPLQRACMHGCMRACLKMFQLPHDLIARFKTCCYGQTVLFVCCEMAYIVCRVGFHQSKRADRRSLAALDLTTNKKNGRTVSYVGVLQTTSSPITCQRRETVARERWRNTRL
jgi:hypothetical protein